MSRKHLVALYLAVVGISAGMGWYTFGPVRAQSEDPRKTELRGLMYPRGAPIRGEGNAPSEGDPPYLFHTVMTTSDDVGKVFKYYSERLKSWNGKFTKKVTDVTPGKSIHESFQGEGWFQAWCGRDDSVTSSGGKEARSVTVRVINVYNANLSYTLVISRAQDEDKTHIVLTYFAR